MILYHGTSERNAQMIEEEGFMGSELSDFTDGFTVNYDGVVYFADNIEYASEYGPAIIAVDWLDDDMIHHFGSAPYSDDKEYWVSVEDLREFAKIERIA